MPPPGMIDTVYTGREARFRALADAAGRRSRTVSRARLALFLGGAALAIAAWSSEGPWGAALGAAAALCGAAFLVFVALHGRIDERERLFSTFARINREQEARRTRNWAEAPEVPAPSAPEHHPFAADLDLLGHASVLTLLGAVGTPRGAQTLRAWLLDPAHPDIVAARQEAVAELSPDLDFRQELLAHALLAHGPGARDGWTGLDRFLEWAEGEPWLLGRPALVWGARLLSAAAVALAAAHAAGVTGAPLWLVPIAVNVSIWFAGARRIEHAFNRAFARGNAPRSEARMFSTIGRARFASATLSALRRTVDGADRALIRLQTLMELADIRLTTLVHFPLNAVTLWDFHVLYALERWQTGAGRRMRGWFDAAGELEALSALAGLRHDEPGWAVPVFQGEPVLDARGLGHPLIKEGMRVANDVRVGPPGTFLFVTGSNMSGKSTLLRAIGVNVALAQAGGPVCAASMRLPRVRIQTSMRVQDSLEEGVSYFMAALRRLKAILEDARTEPGTGVLLYLLDELLQGTNTAERQIAVRTVLTQLLASGAIGAVTSHDLNLADAEELRAAAVPVHFTEHFQEGPDGLSMTFDYVLRPGVATSRNALKLMRMIGIGGSGVP